MNKNSLEYRVRRRSEISDFMGERLDVLMEREAEQQALEMACRAIHWHVRKNRASAGEIRSK